MTGLHRPIVFSFIDRYSVIVINLLMTMIVARLMTPDEIGVFVIGAAVVVLMESLRDFGVSAYLIQVQEITEGGVRTAFTATLILSLIFAIGIYLLAGPVARFYGDLRIVPVLHITAFSFLFGPFVAPNVSLLRRDLSFGSVALINVSGAIANFVGTLTLAVIGAGYLKSRMGCARIQHNGCDRGECIAAPILDIPPVTPGVAESRRFRWVFQRQRARERDLPAAASIGARTNLVARRGRHLQPSGCNLPAA